MICPYNCIKIDFDGVPVYSSLDVEIYGPPHEYGIDAYRVEEAREHAHPMVMDWQMEVEAKRALRPIHRYCRISRFRNVLFTLIMERGSVPQTVLDLVRHLNPDSANIWILVRKVLTRNKIVRKYVNQIPAIIKALGGPSIVQYDWGILKACLNQFCEMSRRFDRERVGNKYFPSLRFVAVKLLESNGAIFRLPIQLAVVKCKREAMQDWWNKFYLLKP